MSQRIKSGFQSLIGILVSLNEYNSESSRKILVSIPNRDFSEFKLVDFSPKSRGKSIFRFNP